MSSREMAQSGRHSHAEEEMAGPKGCGRHIKDDQHRPVTTSATKVLKKVYLKESKSKWEPRNQPLFSFTSQCVHYCAGTSILPATDLSTDLPFLLPFPQCFLEALSNSCVKVRDYFYSTPLIS